MIDEKKLLDWLSKKTFKAEVYNEDFDGTVIGNLICLGDVIDVAEELEIESKASEWIPCSERLPEKENELYWTTHEDGSVVLHSYTKRNGFTLNWEVDDLEKRKRQGSVIAWVLIQQPESYKERR